MSPARAQARPTDRRWSDKRGTRRASVEFGGKGAGRRPSTSRQRSASPWGRQADRSRRLVRAARRHKGGLLWWAGVLALLASMWAFTGLTQVVAGVLSVGIASAGVAVRHHQRVRTANSSSTHTATRQEIKDHHDAMARAGQRPRPDTGGDTVRVKSHSRDGHGVKTHTRRKAGTSGNASGTDAPKKTPRKTPARKPAS